MTRPALALAALSLLAPVAHAKKDTEECLRTKIWDTYGDGWAVRTSAEAEVGYGKTQFYKVSLLKGRAYRVLTCANDGVKNLDVLLYDKEGQVLARDETVDADPVLAYTPQRTGIYYVVLYLRDATDRDAPQKVSWALIHNDG